MLENIVILMFESHFAILLDFFFFQSGHFAKLRHFWKEVKQVEKKHSQTQDIFESEDVFSLHEVWLSLDLIVEPRF